MKKIKLQVGELIEDLALYPRRKISDQHVSNLAEARRAGITFPDLIVDQKHRIIDGFHRRRVYEMIDGPQFKVMVEVREYPDDQAAFLDAVKLNSAHGMKLARADEIRCITHARSLGVEDEVIAQALNVTTARVEHLSTRVVIHEATREVLPTKIVARHLVGTEVTAEQAAAMDRGPGIAPLRLIHDLRDWLRTGLIDMEDERLRTALQELRETLDEALLQPA